MRRSLILTTFSLLVVAAAIGMFLRQGSNQSLHLIVSDAIAMPAKDQQGLYLVSMKLLNQGEAVTISEAHSGSDIEASVHGIEGSAKPVVPAGSEAAFAMDGAHIRLSNGSGEFDDGQLVPVTLLLGDGSKTVTKARVILSGAMQHGGMVSAQEIDFHASNASDQPNVAINIAGDPKNQNWSVNIETDNFVFSKEQMDGPHVPGTGHGHIYLNGLKLGRVFSDSFAIGALPRGTHLVRVTLNTNNHQVYLKNGKPLTAKATILVD